jgi:hypothetical protein
MPYYDVANLVTVTKTNMIDEMLCGYGTVMGLEVKRRKDKSTEILYNSYRIIVV